MFQCNLRGVHQVASHGHNLGLGVFIARQLRHFGFSQTRFPFSAIKFSPPPHSSPLQVFVYFIDQHLRGLSNLPPTFWESQFLTTPFPVLFEILSLCLCHLRHFWPSFPKVQSILEPFSARCSSLQNSFKVARIQFQILFYRQGLL